MHSENKNVLCLFEKNSAGKWVLKAKSSEIVKQGERIPLITSEEYGIYYVSYIDDDRKSELSLEIEKKKDGWYVTRINWDKDNVFMELSLYENKIEYLKIVYANGGSKSTRTTVEGVTPPTSFAEFSLDNIPMTPEKAREQLSLPPDIPQSAGEYSLPQPQKDKLEFLCNECCWFGCTDRRRCYENVSRRNLGELCPEHRCMAPGAAEGYRFSKAMRNPGFIGVEDIRSTYLPMGFSQFKIEGRGLGSALVLEFLLYYLTKPEHQLQVREEIYLDNMLDLF